MSKKTKKEKKIISEVKNKMTDLKIIGNSDLDILEEEVNEFLRLKAWYGREMTKVKIISNYNYFYSFIFTEPMKMTTDEKNIAIITKSQNPKYHEEMKRLHDKLYKKQEKFDERN